MMRPVAILALAAVVAGCAAPSPTSWSPEPSLITAEATRQPAIPPTAAPTPTNEVRWDRVGTIKSAMAEGWFGAVGFEDGYIVFDGSEVLDIRFSPDGVTWKRVLLPFDNGAVVEDDDVASDGGRVVVVGAYSPCRDFSWEMDPAPKRCRMRPVSWVSDDGRTWRSSGPWTGTVAPADWFGSTFSAVWAVATGGWDAAQVFFSSNEGDAVGPALWHSDDGVTWTLLRAWPLEPEGSESRSDPYSAAFRALTDTEGRRVAWQATGCGSDGVQSILSTSIDGRQYERLEAFPGTCSESIGAGLAPTGSGPWLFLGQRVSLGSSSSQVEAIGWASDDLSVWTAFALPVPQDTVESVVSALGHGVAGYVATGHAGRGGNAQPQFITWLSDDGMTWRIAIARPTTGADDFVDTFADGPAGMLGFGCGHPACEGKTMAVWRLEKLGV